MNSEVKTDLSLSARDFLEIVWPAVGDKIGGGIIYPVESVSSEGFARDLDALSGIDAWQQTQGQMRGIASRVQRTDTNWATFTIRWRRSSGSKTEYEKRLYAIQVDRGFLYPHLTIQSYVSISEPRTLIAAAIVRTKDLILFVRNGTAGEDYDLETNRHDGNQFAVVAWERLNTAGIECLVIPDLSKHTS